MVALPVTTLVIYFLCSMSLPFYKYVIDLCAKLTTSLSKDAFLMADACFYMEVFPCPGVPA